MEEGLDHMEDRTVETIALAKNAEAKDGDAGNGSLAAALGEAVSLLTQSPGHRYLFVGDLDWAALSIFDYTLVYL